jgi:hypothetical protein
MHDANQYANRAKRVPDGWKKATSMGRLIVTLEAK